MKKKIFLSIIIIISISAFVGIMKAKADVPSNILGWIWGGSDDGNVTGLGKILTGVGSISVSSINCDADSNGQSDGTVSGCPAAGTAVANYGVQIPNSDGSVIGYAWNENLGYIDFNPQNHCGSAYSAASCADPDGGSGGVSRSGNSLLGWARIVDIAKESANSNSGGWAGWIKMKGIAQDGSSYGVVIDTIAEELNGYAWNGEGADGLGAVSFSGVNYGAYFPQPPTVTLQNTTLINIKTTNLPYTVTLTWSSNNATGCDASSSGSGVSWNENNVGTAGTHDINIPAGTGMNMNYTVTCTNSVGSTDSTPVNISTVCYPQKCQAQICGDDESNSSFIGASNLSDCDAASSCSSDGDCAPRNIKGWREILP
jgi:hypothetical protein